MTYFDLHFQCFGAIVEWPFALRPFGKAVGILQRSVRSRAQTTLFMPLGGKMGGRNRLNITFLYVLQSANFLSLSLTDKGFNQSNSSLGQEILQAWEFEGQPRPNHWQCHIGGTQNNKPSVNMK